MNLDEDYPEVWEGIEKKRIPSNKIDEILLQTLLKIIQEIEEGKRNELDIGDVFGLGIQHAMVKEYKLNPEVEDFLWHLGSYKDEPFENSIPNESESIEKVKEKAHKLLDKNIKIKND